MRHAFYAVVLTVGCAEPAHQVDGGSFPDASTADASAADAAAPGAADGGSSLDTGAGEVEDAGRSEEDAGTMGPWLMADGWTNVVVPETGGQVDIEFDVMVGSRGDGVVGFGRGDASEYGDLAFNVRFNDGGMVDVRDGDAYAADSALSYELEAVYRVSFEVDMDAHRYSAYVERDGVRTTLRSGAEFRTSQQSESVFDRLIFYHDDSRISVRDLRIDGVSVDLVVAPPPPPPPPTESLWSIDFQASDEGPYTDARVRAEWEGVRWVETQGRVDVRSEGDNRFIRVRYPRGAVGPNEGGAQWLIEFDRFRDTTYEELCLAYRMRFRGGFDFVRGGKLPGLVGGEANTGGRIPDGRDGWSGRMMWRVGGEMVQYVYHADQPDRYGDDRFWERGGMRLRFPTDEWVTVEHCIEMNTPGTSNGRIRGWYNGELAMDDGDFRFRDVDTFAIDGFMFSTFFGGNTPAFEPSRNEWVDFDDFQFSDGPITH